MSKSFRFLSSFLIFLFIIACGSTPQVTEQPAVTPNSFQQNQTTVIPTQSDPDQIQTQSAAEPSGLKVAFNLDGNIWFWSETTPARQLTTDNEAGQVKLSDDGKVIVYTRGPVLWAINSDGANHHQLVDAAAFSGRPFLAQFDFQPNTHLLYFSTRDSVQATVGSDLHRVDADKPSPQTLLLQGGRFTFSPDGRLLALADFNRINVLRTDNPALVSALDFVQVNTHADWWYYPQVVWLNDSSGFYTVIPASDTGQKSRFLYVAADGSFSAQLAEFTAADIRISQPLIAPDGTKVAYLTTKEDTFDVHVIDASTADMIIATHPISPQFGLWSWSPDSARFTYWTEEPSRLFIAGMNNQPVPLVDVVASYTLTWVDANRFLYFASGELRLGQAGNAVLAVIASGYADGNQNTSYFDFTP